MRNIALGLETEKREIAPTVGSDMLPSMNSDLQKVPPRMFPPLLREIPDPPKQLYVRGEFPSFDRAWLAVVGSRALTSYGKQACEYLIEGLRGYEVVIVSGLAYGADACA